VKLLTFLLLLLPAVLPAQSPKSELLTYRTSSLCDLEGNGCISLFTDVRLLKITAPVMGATAYQIQIITPGANGERRTWEYITPRNERRYGAFANKTSATFFAIPIDIDIPILDIWITSLAASGEPDHQVVATNHP
jgi:hypothetical protein